MSGKTWDVKKLIESTLMSEKLCMFFFMITLTVNHISLYYSNLYLKSMFLFVYVWIALVFFYHSAVTRKYLSGHLFKAAYLFLMINVIFTFLWKENLRISVFQDFAQMILYLFLCFGSYYSNDGTDRRTAFNRFLKVFLMATFAVSLASIVAVYLNSPLVSIQPGYPADRARGFYYETNEGGLNAFASIMIAVYFLSQNKESNLTKTVCMLNIPVQAIMISCNGSRTSALAVFLAAAIILIRHFRDKYKISLRLLLISFVGLTVIFFAMVLIFSKYGTQRNMYYYFSQFPTIKELSVQEIMDSLDSFSSYRYSIWKTSIEEIKRSPWIGFGLKSGNFTYRVFRNYSNSHNLIINSLLFSGIIGTFCFLLYGVELRNQIIRNTIAKTDRILGVMMVGYISISMLEMAFFYNGKAITALGWAVLGYLASPKNSESAEMENSVTLFERVKNCAAVLMNFTGILSVLMRRCYRNSQVIRVINYHRTPVRELKTFEKQLQWYSKKFENVDKKKFEQFMKGELVLEKPGIILSFDDGLLNNYRNAAPLLEKYGFTGWFFVSAGLADGTEYMTYRHMKKLLNRGHVLGCHTFSHHRMDENDTDEILNHEIIEAKQLLEKKTCSDIDIFCWCGGEEDTYTSEAQKMIRNNYHWGFMTNNELVTPDTDHFQLQRTNVEARWPLATAKLQVSGLMDYLYRSKRSRVNSKTA